MLTLLLMLAAPKQIDFKVDGVTRQMIVYAPEKPSAAGAPVVFAFHGHGGGMRQAARSFGIHDAFPEALVVYMQGLPTSGKTDPEGRKAGWQVVPGGEGDRDIKAFDAAFKIIEHDYKIDKKRVYAMGHSNGARFSWLLWGMRGDKFAAFGASSAPAGLFLRGAEAKPVFVIAGEKDPIVSYESMKLSVVLVRRMMNLDETPKTSGLVSTYHGPQGLEMVTYIHPGGHVFIHEAVPMMVDFFRRHHL